MSIINLNLESNTKKVLIALSLASVGLLTNSLINNAWANIAMPMPNNSSVNQEYDDKSPSKVKETQIKEKAKVYRDPFGNVIASPVKKGEDNGKNSTSDNIDSKDDENLKPTSSIGIKKSSITSNDSNLQNNDTTPHSSAKLNVAVVYFSVPENIHHHDVDVLSGASVVLTKDNHSLGTVAYLAQLINEQIQGNLFEIKSNINYPKDHQELVLKTAHEKDNHARPIITMSPEFNPIDYDVIFLGYPIWWHDLPMPLYSFFESYDLSGKTIVPFCTHGGNRPYKTFDLIAQREPNAQIIANNGLVLNRYQVPIKGESLVQEWLKKIKSNVLDTKYGHLRPTLTKDNKAIKETNEPNDKTLVSEP